MPPTSSWRRRLLRAAGVLALAVVLLSMTVTIAVWWMLQRPTLVQVHPEHAETFRIADVQVVDVDSGTASGPKHVDVQDGVIIGIWPADHPPAAPATVIDGAGRWLVPGLIDAHCHVMADATPPWIERLPDPQLSFERLLYSGVTRVFDPGSAVPIIFDLREELNSGRRLGPSLHAAGPVFTAVGGHPVPMVRLMAPPIVRDLGIAAMIRQIDSVQTARTEVAELAPARPDFIKMAIDHLPLDAPLLSADLAEAIVQAADAHDLQTVAHIGTTHDAFVAADAGAVAWIHGIYKEEVSVDNAEKLAGYGIPMIPTMVVFRAYGEMARGDYPATPLETEVMAAEDLAARGDPEGSKDPPDNLREYIAHIRAHRQTALDNVARLHAAGVTILAGSDAQSGVISGPALHRELALMHRTGMSPAEVLRSATLHNARFLSGQADPPYGEVAVGKRADLVLLRADPLEDPAALSEIDDVFTAGRRLLRTPWPQE